MKRLLPLILSLFFLLTACSNSFVSTDSTDLPETTTTIFSPQIAAPSNAVTLTIDAGSSYVNSDKFPEWGEDEISRRIMDMNGIKLVFQHNGSLDILLASHEMPDLIYTASDKEIAQLNTPDYSQSLDTLAKEHCPEFWNDLDELEILTNQQSDGHVYALINGYMTDDVYDDSVVPLNAPRFMSLRSDVLGKLNADMPTSVEELESLLYTAKDKMQELGITSVLRQYSPTASPVAEWMGVKRFLQWDAEAQKIITPLRDDAWVPYLQLAARWYRDGVLTLPPAEPYWRSAMYIPWEYASDQSLQPAQFYSDTLSGSFVTAGDEMAYQVSGLYGINTSEKGAGVLLYSLFEEPLTYENEMKFQTADQQLSTPKLPGIATDRGALFITNSCTHPEAAINFIAFLKGDEGSQLVSWGLENTHFTRTEEGKLEYNAEADLTGVHHWDWLENAHTEAYLKASPVADNINKDYIALREMQIRAGLNYKKYAAENKNPVFGLAEPDPGTDTYTQYIQLQDYWHHAVWELVTTAADSVAVAEGWEAIKSELVTRGIEDVEQAMTVRFTDALPRFQQAGYYTDIIIR